MKFRSRLGSLGNSSAASGSSHPVGTVGLSYSYAVRTNCLHPAVLLYILTFIFSPSSSLCLISFLLFQCSRVWENTSAWGCILCSHTEWYLLSSLSLNINKICKRSVVKLNLKLTRCRVCPSASVHCSPSGCSFRELKYMEPCGRLVNNRRACI